MRSTFFPQNSTHSVLILASIPRSLFESNIAINCMISLFAFKSWLSFLFQLPASMYQGGSSWWLMCLGPSHPCRRPRLSFRLLISAWPFFGYYSHLGSELSDGISLSLCLWTQSKIKIYLIIMGGKSDVRRFQILIGMDCTCEQITFHLYFNRVIGEEKRKRTLGRSKLAHGFTMTLFVYK